MLGESRDGSLTMSAEVQFTEDVGGSEIVYLQVGAIAMSTVLGADSAALAGLSGGKASISINPESLVVFDPVALTRIAQGVRRD